MVGAMTRATLTINSEFDRARGLKWLRDASLGFTVEFKRHKRSTPQNARMWAMLSIIAHEVEWHGVKLSPEDWKLIFMAALQQEMRIVPNLDGTGFVNLGGRSSKLTKQEHSDLTMLIEKFAAERGVDLGERAA
jgi:hypothetical protein